MKARVLLLGVLASVAFLALAGRAADKEEIATGVAPISHPDFREEALADALRNAVRQGAGVYLSGETMVTNFALHYDRVFVSAFGYVRQYGPLAWGVSNQQYQVTVRAVVRPDQPKMKDELCLEQLSRLKGSPRVVLWVTELVEGLPQTKHVMSWFETAARKVHLNVVDRQYVAREQMKETARDDAMTNRVLAQLRQAGLAQDADLLLEVAVKTRYLGKSGTLITQREVFPPMHRFSVIVEILRAVRPDYGAVVVPLKGWSREDLVTDKEDLEAAAQEVVHKTLEGGGLTDPTPSASELFRRLFAKWAAEVDLGALVALEFYQMTSDEWDLLVRRLHEAKGITSVFEREYTRDGLSRIDVETRLGMTGLKTVLLQALGGKFTADHLTGHYHRYKRAAATTGSEAASPAPK
jgi:hypothetical protein